MKRSGIQKQRKLVSVFSSRLDSETLNIRIYRDRETFVCEREIVERDGTSFTMVLPFDEPEAARKLFASDPYFSHVERQVGHVLVRLARILRDRHGTKHS